MGDSSADLAEPPHANGTSTPGTEVLAAPQLKVTDDTGWQFAAAAREIAEAAEPLVKGGCYLLPEEGGRWLLDLYADVVRLRYDANLVLVLLDQKPVGEINVDRNESRPSRENAVTRLRKRTCEFGEKYAHAQFPSEWLTRDITRLTAAASSFEQTCEMQENAAIATKPEGVAIA